MDLSVKLLKTCHGTSSAESYFVSRTFFSAGVRSLVHFLAGISRSIAVLKSLLVLAVALAASSGFATTLPPGTSVIGASSTLTLPSSALYHNIIGNSPADGSVQGLNPPVFNWIYTEDPSLAGTSGAYRIFRFQLTTNGNFATPYWNIVCSNNFYNFLPPITNSDGSPFQGTISWHIIYMDASQNVVGTGSTHTFTLTPTATLWDRSMLADPNYLRNIAGSHPHMWFNPGNLAAMSTFLQTKPWPTYGQPWSTVVNSATAYQVQSWWGKSSVTNLAGEAILQALDGPQKVAFEYYMSGSNSMWDIQGAATTLDYFATAFRQRNYDQMDPYSVDPGSENAFATAYDWLYPFMTAKQRSNVLYTLKSLTQFCAYQDNWAYESQPSVTNRVYTNALQVTSESCMKMGLSHPRYNAAVGLECCIAALGDDADLMNLFPLFMNYSFAQFDPYQGDEGRGYSEQDNFKYDREFGAAALACVQFPEAKLWMNPIFTNLGTFFANWEPVGWRSTMEPWGDLGYGFRSQWFHTRYYDLALLTQNGAILRHYDRSWNFRVDAPEGYPLCGEAFLPFYFPTPLEADWTESTYFDPVRGWAMSSLYKPSDWNAFTNGVGFVFQARPGGSRIEHSSFTDGQVELWAYGANCVAAGSAGGYAKHPMYYNGLMVNGIGMMNPVPPVDPVYSKFLIFTNNQNFTYAAADLTKSFNRSNYDTVGLGNMTFPFYTYASNTVPYVSDIQRHVVFPHKKYLVIYDQMQTTQPAKFQWLWHVLEPTVTMNAANAAFTYTCTNDYNGSNVTVYVQHIVNPSLMTITNVAGTNLCKYNPFTGENYMGLDNDTGPFMNNVIWAYNNTPTTDWHFMTVIYPVKWGDSPPIITRIDDYTVKVQKGGLTDTINFAPSGYQPTLTLQLQAGPNPLQNLHLGP